MISFEEFIRAVHGEERCPYPWQERFADRCASGTPPSLVGVPTGCGKTTVVDALVWALACQADRPSASRTVGARIVWAIDRRILVDEVHAHADALADRLLRAQHDDGDPLNETAIRLAGMSGETPLVATRWRGGLAVRRSLHSPTQAQVITSTIAQVGSRLLFRGYGVGRRSLALEAGLAACDTTICLDEAHISEPFRQTAVAIKARRAESELDLDLPGLGVITLTATPTDRDADVILLEDDDRRDTRLRRRLEAPKVAQLEEGPPTERERVKLLATTTTDYVNDGAPTVACVVNTVKRAREVFDLVSRELVDDEVDVTLLVGPQRPADREGLLDRHGDRLFGRNDSDRPLICVATQTFEVGLDADVAAMVTDSASASALVQRLGRLNRRGAGTGRATIIRDEGSWLYEADEPLAWDWLRSRETPDGSVDVSVAALEADRSRPSPSHVPSAPSLTDSALELLVQTNPQPGPWQEPSVEGFLRGAEDKGSTDVTVCWRCDLLPDVEDPAAEGYREMLLELVPPQERELLPLSIKSARALITARYTDGKPGKAATVAVSDADVEGGSEPARVPDPTPGDIPVPFLIVRRGEVRHGTLSDTRGEKIGASDLVPGDTLILPTQAGGVDSHGLAPTAPAGRAADAARNDVADDRRRELVRSEESTKPVPVRLSPSALGIERRVDWFRIDRDCLEADRRPLSEAAGAVDSLAEKLALMFPTHTALSALTGEKRALLEQPIRILLRPIGPVAEGDLPTLGEDEADAIEGGDGQDLGDEAPPGSEGGSVQNGAPQAAPAVLRRTWVLVPVRDRERDRRRRSEADPPPTLDAHALAVRARVNQFAENSGLSDSLRSALSLAAAGHDHGKADHRVQAFFNAGVRLLGAEPIAKSIFGTDDPRTERLARAAAGLPRGLRHEIGSVAAVSNWLSETRRAPDVDHDLALHLVASHHGQGRPIPRPPTGGEDPQPFHADAAGIQGQATGDGDDGWADGEWLQRFWRVVDRYGEWGTAYLEATLVLADHSVSAEGG